MGLLDSIRSLRGIDQFDLIKAEIEAQDFAAEQEAKAKQDQALFSQKVIEDSVEQQVREKLERLKAVPIQYNLDPQDTTLSMPPETAGGVFPGSPYGLITYDILRAMANTPIPTLIISRRLMQMRPFTRRRRNGVHTGYRVRMRDYSRAPSAAAERRIQELEAYLETCGDPSYGVSFTQFMLQLMNDSLRFDQGVFEKALDKNGKPALFQAVDATTIRLAQLTDKEIEGGRYDTRKRGYVQIMDMEVVNKWAPPEMSFCIRNQDTDIRRNGYGYPELEKAYRMVKYLLQAEFFNGSNFTNGIHAAAIMGIKSTMNREAFAQFKGQLKQQMVGATNANRLVVAQMDPTKNESIDITPLSMSNKDMQFVQWYETIHNIMCAYYGMDPAELRVTGQGGGAPAMSRENSKDRIEYSKEQGLEPIVTDFFDWVNQGIIFQLDSDFEAEPVGLHNKNTLEQVQIRGQQVQTTRTVNEMRAEEDKAPLGDPQDPNSPYNMPLSPLIVNTLNQRLLQAQQAQQQPGQGAPAQPDGEMPPEDLPPEELPPDAMQAPEDGAQQDEVFDALPDDFDPYDETLDDEEIDRMSNGRSLVPMSMVKNLHKGDSADVHAGVHAGVHVEVEL